VTRQAFGKGLIEQGEVWMDMIKDRNRTSHTYNKETAKKIADNVRTKFFDEFVALQVKMQSLQTEEDE